MAGGWAKPPRSSPSRTSFHEHFACFFVQPIHAVRFFRQSMCSRRQRSHGGKMRSPLASVSILCTISVLNGPPSSFSTGWLLRWLAAGSKLEGVLGIGTGEFIIECSSDSFICDGRAKFGGGISTGLGGALETFATGVDGCEMPWTDNDGRRASVVGFGGWDDGRRSLIVWNLESNSCRVVEEVPLPLPALLLPFPLLLLSCTGRALTATKPPGDFCEVWGGGALGAAALPPFMRATFDGLVGRAGGAGLAVARRSSIACLRPFSLWLSCRVRAATETC
jgi:hypothetical protein